jgi:hypothetical protein
MDNKEEVKGKPGPKPKEKVIEKIEPVEVVDPNFDPYASQPMVKVLVPKRQSNGTIISWEEKEVSKALAEIEIKAWEDFKITGIPGHSAWRDVEFSN